MDAEECCVEPRVFKSCRLDGEKKFGRGFGWAIQLNMLYSFIAQQIGGRKMGMVCGDAGSAAGHNSAGYVDVCSSGEDVLDVDDGSVDARDCQPARCQFARAR